MNTAKILPPTKAEIDAAADELYEALLGDNGEYHPWDKLVKEVNERYGFDADETV